MQNQTSDEPLRGRMMEVLQERRLSLSRKKSRMGHISKGMHFLGIDYPGTRTRESNTNVVHANDDLMQPTSVQILCNGGARQKRIINSM